MALTQLADGNSYDGTDGYGHGYDCGYGDGTDGYGGGDDYGYGNGDGNGDGGDDYGCGNGDGNGDSHNCNLFLLCVDRQDLRSQAVNALTRMETSWL